MRWSRHDPDTTLGELMDSPAPAPDDRGTSSTVVAPDEDTSVHPRSGDGAEDPVAERPTEVADPDAGFLDDEDYLPQERRGPGRLTVALVAALVLAVGVLGGVWVEKQLGSTASAGQGVPGGGAGGQGFPGGAAGGQGVPGGTASGQGVPGGTTGGQGVPEGASSGSAGTQAGSGGGTASGSTTTTTPVVVGTVSSAGTKSLVVTDLGGTKHTVTVTTTTTVTAPYGHGSVAAGDTVAVTGTTSTDGSVTATGVTVS